MSAGAHTIPEDIFQTACGIVMEAKSLKSMLKHKDVIDAIAAALAAEREKAAIEERSRIAFLMLHEADLTPCGEDAMVTRSNAFLIEADFSYEEAERLSNEGEAA